MSDTISPRQVDHTKERAKYVSKSIKWSHRMLWADLVLYVVFLLTYLLAALAPFVSVAWDGHMLINVFSKYANTLEWPDPSNTFQEIHSVADFWSWWRGPFRAVLLGKDPYSEDEPLQRRPGHVNGTLLNNVVVGTVRLRQKRVRLECDRRNELSLPQSAMLCYAPDIWDGESTDDWAWPHFLATSAANSTSSEAEAPADAGAAAPQQQRRRLMAPQKLTHHMRPQPGGRLSMAALRSLLQDSAPSPADPDGDPEGPAEAAADASATTAAPTATNPPAAAPPVDTDVGTVTDSPVPVVDGDVTASPAESPVIDGDVTATPVQAPVVDGDVTPAPAQAPVVDDDVTATPAETPVIDGDADEDPDGEDDNGDDDEAGAAPVAPVAEPANAPASPLSAPATVSPAPAAVAVDTAPQAAPPAPATSAAVPAVEVPAAAAVPAPEVVAPADDTVAASDPDVAVDGDVGGEAPAAPSGSVLDLFGDVIEGVVEPPVDGDEPSAAGPAGAVGAVSPDPATAAVPGAAGSDEDGIDTEDDSGEDTTGAIDDVQGADTPTQDGDVDAGEGAEVALGDEASGEYEESGADEVAGEGPAAGEEERVPVSEEEAEREAAAADRRRSRRARDGDDPRTHQHHEHTAAGEVVQLPPSTDDGSGGDQYCATVDDPSQVWLFGASVPNRTCDDILADKEEYLRRTPAFKYRSHEDLSSAVYTSKTSLRMFDGSGYAHDFDVKDEDAFDEVTDLLSSTSWVDAATRFLVVEMTLYSPATDLVAAVFFMVEIHGSGLAESRIGYEAFRLQYYSHFLGWGRLAVEVLFVILCVGIFAADIVPAILKREGSFRQHWSRNPFFWMSVLMMATTLTIVGLRIHNVTALANFSPEDVASGSDPFGSDFAKLHGPSSRLRIERSLGALLSFCVWLRVFKYTRNIPVFGTIGRTITRAFPAIVTFLLMSTVVFLGFAQSFFLGFYVSNDGFQTLMESVMSMLRLTTGDVDYDALNRTNTVLAPLLYTLSLFVLGFVWTSLLLAIVINAYYDEVNDEGTFEFDEDFQNFSIGNPLLRKHKEWDADAMAGTNGSPLLTPARYNRFVVNSLTRFDHAVPMVAMTMAQFLEAARNGRVPGQPGGPDDNADGETLPIARPGRRGGRGNSLRELSPTSPVYRHGGEDSSPRVVTDSEHIVVRFGQLKGVRKVFDTHALYFPLELDEHRCRAWWEMHKHHLRVGDAAVRYLKKQAPRNFVSVIKRPLAPIAGRIAQPGNGLLGSIHLGSRRTNDHVSQGGGDGLGPQGSLGSGSSPHPARRSFAFYRNASKASRGTAADASSERSTGDDALDVSSASRSWSLFHSMRSSRGARGLNRSTSAAAAAAAAAVSAGEGGEAAPDGRAVASARQPAEAASAPSSPRSPQAASLADGGSAATSRARRRRQPPPHGGTASGGGSPLPLTQLPVDPAEAPAADPQYPPPRMPGPAPAAPAPQPGPVPEDSDSLLDWNNSPLPSGMSVIPEVTETLTATMEFGPLSTGRLGTPPGVHATRRPPGAAEPPVGLSAGSVEVASTSTTDIMSMAHSPLTRASPGPEEIGAFGERRRRASGDDGARYPPPQRPADTATRGPIRNPRL